MRLHVRSIGIAVLLAMAFAPCAETAANHPAPRLVDILGTLRRAQNRADLDDARLQRELRFLSRHPAIGGRPVRRLVRLATVAPWGQKVFLVPTRRRGGALTLGGPATAGATAAQIEAGGDWGTNRTNQLLIVVPDGVATVTVQPVRTPVNRHPSPVTATVRSNVAAFESCQNLDDPQREVWYGPSGDVIERVARP